MSTEKDVIKVALEVGQKVLMNVQGDPVKTLAYGVAAAVAAVAAVGAGIGYGSFDRKFLRPDRKMSNGVLKAEAE